MKKNKRKKYQKPDLKSINVKEVNIKAMTGDNREICMMTVGGSCHI